MERDQQAYDPTIAGERRAPERLLFSPDQILGRAPIRLRRRSDKRRFAAHLLIAAFLVSLSVWWVIPRHAFAGEVILTLTPGHGVHIGDLPVLLYGAIAGRSLLMARRVLLATAR